nr:CBS domain-containing protein CBSCBSPB5 [Tanacetum cinerariifolium]
VMTPNPQSATIDTLIVEALRIMNDGKFLHLPVVDRDGDVVAVIDVLQITDAAVALMTCYCIVLTRLLFSTLDDKNLTHMSVNNKNVNVFFPSMKTCPGDIVYVQNEQAEVKRLACFGTLGWTFHHI